MRIAVHIGTRIWGGQERAVIRLMAGLRDRGHDVMLLCNSDAVLERAQASGITARRCVIGGDAMVSHSIRLAIELRRIQPDVFVVGTYKKLFVAALGARLARVPRTVMRVGLESHTRQEREVSNCPSLVDRRRCRHCDTTDCTLRRAGWIWAGQSRSHVLLKPAFHSMQCSTSGQPFLPRRTAEPAD